MKKLIRILFVLTCISFFTAYAENGFDADNIPLKKVTLYSSGVGHYEHEGEVKGSGRISLLFSVRQLNDVLKSLVISDSAAKNLSIEYQSENALLKALESLKINLSGASGLYDILSRQRGAEVEVFTPNKISGKLLSAERKGMEPSGGYLSLAADGKIQIIAFSDIHAFRFTDEKLNADLNTALSLISENREGGRKPVSVNIKAENEERRRNVKLSYVMEAPVWKAGYRLDAGENKAEFQAWAIIDNSSDLDWKNIKLTLTAGKPAAFIQNLYTPHYTGRPELPLLIAGAALPEILDSGIELTFKEEKEKAAYEENSYEGGLLYKKSGKNLQVQKRLMDRENTVVPHAELGEDLPSTPYFDGQLESGTGKGEMFSFTPSSPVNLERQKSTMIPLALTSIPAEKISVFSEMYPKVKVNPKFCLNIENTSDLKFPAGPVTVFDNGEYAGDAVLEFLPAGEKRLIAYGDDIELSGIMTGNSSQYFESVKIANGVITVYYKNTKETEYTVKNSSDKNRSVIVEHPVNEAFKLITEKNLSEKTANKYRFKLEAHAGKEEKLVLKEEKIIKNTMEILRADEAFFISLQSNKELSGETKKTFDAIIIRRNKLNGERENLRTLQNERNKLTSEQERTRKNLEAFGKEAQQSREFITKLLNLEKTLEELASEIEKAENKLRLSEKEFSEFIKGIKIE